MKLHLAILTYDALACTRRCLASLLAHTSGDFELWIVDNASTDGTRDWLRGLDAPRIHVGCNDHNRGVPGGRNDLLDRILPVAADDDLVVFLDNDLELGPGWDLRFRALFAERAEVGLAARVGWVIHVGVDDRTPLALPDETAPVDIASGGFACCARVRAIREVGRMDENLGLFYHEDDDWSLRFAGAGWQVWCVPEAPVVHHEHASGVAWEALEDGRSARNLAYLCRKWRALDLVDDEGWPRHRDPLLHPSPALRASLRTALGRPLGRAEYARTHWDLGRLERLVAAGLGFDRPRAPALVALCQALAAGRAGFDPVHGRELLAALDGGAPASGWIPAPEHDQGARSASGWARIEDFDAAPFRQALAELGVDDGFGDWYRRRGTDWARARSLILCAEAGRLVPGTRALVLSCPDRGPGRVLAAHGVRVVAGTTPGMKAAEPLPPGLVLRPLAELGEQRFDLVLVEDQGGGGDAAPLYGFVARHLAEGGLGIVIGERRVGDPAHEESAIVGAGLRRLGGEDRPSAATLASAWVPGRVGQGPSLCARHGGILRAVSVTVVSPERSSVPVAGSAGPSPGGPGPGPR